VAERRALLFSIVSEVVWRVFYGEVILISVEGFKSETFASFLYIRMKK